MSSVAEGWAHFLLCPLWHGFTQTTAKVSTYCNGKVVNYRILLLPRSISKSKATCSSAGGLILAIGYIPSEFCPSIRIDNISNCQLCYAGIRRLRCEGAGSIQPLPEHNSIGRWNHCGAAEGAVFVSLSCSGRFLSPKSPSVYS